MLPHTVTKKNVMTVVIGVVVGGLVIALAVILAVSYTHLTLPTIYSV